MFARRLPPSQADRSLPEDRPAGRRATRSADWLAELVALERRIVAYDTPPPAGASGLTFLEGMRPVLVSAPHSARHWRGTRWKREEEYTAALAHWLHDRLGVHALYASHRLTPDPHDDADAGAYKRLAAEIVARHDIRLVLDLHGARGIRDFALAVGTIYGQTCTPYEALIVAALGEIGLRAEPCAPSLDRLAINPGRYAGGSHRPTVTRYLWQTTGVAAMQLEDQCLGAHRGAPARLLRRAERGSARIPGRPGPHPAHAGRPDAHHRVGLKEARDKRQRGKRKARPEAGRPEIETGQFVIRPGD